jgi:hypothetical protein
MRFVIEVFIPIRIRSRAKLVWRAEIVENVWLLRNNTKTLEGYYADREAQNRRLRGSA